MNEKEPSAVQKMIGDIAPKLAELTDDVLSARLLHIQFSFAL